MTMMTLHLNRALLKHAYELMAESPPFNKWNLPDSSEITFVVSRSRSTMGYHRFWKDGFIIKSLKHEIGISARCVGSLPLLLQVMGHEMVHLYQVHTKPRTDTKGVEHNPAFHRFSDIICRTHSFDRHGFADADKGSA
jgi:hypothetical protein